MIKKGFLVVRGGVGALATRHHRAGFRTPAESIRLFDEGLCYKSVKLYVSRSNSTSLIARKILKYTVCKLLFLYNNGKSLVLNK